MELTVRNPTYNDRGTIDVLVVFPWLDQEVPFTATPDDSEAHGRELYVRAISGEFGPVAPYVAPPVVDTPPVAVDPVEKLRAFLSANPDVAAIL